MRTIAAVLADLPTSADAGLTAAGVRLSRERFGSNKLTPLPRTSAWRKFVEKFDEPIIKILLAASLLKTVVDLFNGVGPAAGGPALSAVVFIAALGLFVRPLRSWLPAMLFAAALVLVAVSVALGQPSYDGFAVMVAVALATGVAFAAEYQSDREFEALNAGKDAAAIKVVRNGIVQTVPVEEIVVGELVTVEMGDEIPADGRIVRATEFYLDQSLMTGESEPVQKTVASPDAIADGPEEPGCLYRGTQVVDGAGQLLVTEVGDATMLGQLARTLSQAASGLATDRIHSKLSISKELTPLQHKLERLAGTISRVGYAAAIAIFIALLAQGIITGTVHWPRDAAEFGQVARRLLDFLVIMVIIIVVAVPEGLPMSVTVSLALAMRKMTRANSLVRQLVACETIGSATVICSDKTGTLTQNRMRVEIPARLRVETEAPNARLAFPQSSARWLALIAAVNSTAHLEQRDGKLLPLGNTTESALLTWLHDAGIDYADLRRQFPALFQLHFSSDRKRMFTVIRRDGRLVTLVKGAPEMVLSRSVARLADDGTEQPWTLDARADIERQIADAAGRAMRTLAFGYAMLPADTPDTEAALHERRDALDENLVFVGFVAIRDPIREDVPAAIAECRQAGIDVKMITGDNPETARAIAAEIGLIDGADPIVLTSNDFNALSDEQLAEQLPRLRVLARARPLDKLRLVRQLQDQNHVVAMTGDGTNDAPSLKRADVGLAMGIAGTEVAKEASKIILLDDSFATIVKAVHWGRALYENIQRFVQFQLTINVSALVIAFLAPLLGFGEPPFTVLQFLWINIIMDTFAAIALCSEPPRPGLMRVPPKRRDENILTPAMRTTILATAAFFVVIMVTLLLGMKRSADGTPGWFAGPSRWSDEFPLFTVRQATIFFTVYVSFQVWNQMNCRSLNPAESGLARLGSNPVFVLISLLIVIGQVLIVSFGGEVFKVEPLGLIDWVVIAAGTASVLLFGEVLRRTRLFVRALQTSA